MNEFLKLTWQKHMIDDYPPQFLSEEAIADSYIYKSFEKPIVPKTKKKIKLNLATSKYVPGFDCYCPIRRRSLLTQFQKRHCLAAQKLLQSGKKQESYTEKDKFLLKIYNECQPKIIEENRQFLDFVKRRWLYSNNAPAKVKVHIYNYAWNKWKQKFEGYLKYPQYYKEICTLCMSYDESEGAVDFQHVQQALELGTLARFTHPTLKECCRLKPNLLLKIEEQTLKSSQLPVSQDKNIEQFLDSNNFDVVISSSALKQIIDYTSINSKWVIPVVVKELTLKDNQTKKIVFIDKVLPKPNPTAHDLKYYAYKILLKLHFCQYEAFSYPSDGTNDEEEAEVNKDDGNEQMKRRVHHNVNYRIWSINKTHCPNPLMKTHKKDENFKMLVRCKLDACEISDQGVLSPVLIKPKIEQQLQYGATISSQSDLSREWASLFFRLYSNIYRARIYPRKSEIIAVEKCSLLKINSEAHAHYDYRPILGLGVLQKVLSKLLKLECGSYILQHVPKNGSFATVMKQCESSDTAYDLYSECESPKVDTTAKSAWLPIDVNYILPAHEEYSQIPALFHGFDYNNKDCKKFKGKKSKAKKSKAKKTKAKKTK